MRAQNESAQKLTKNDEKHHFSPILSDLLRFERRYAGTSWRGLAETLCAKVNKKYGKSSFFPCFAQ